MTLKFCGSGHAVPTERELLPSGMCITCDAAKLRQPAERPVTLIAPTCPRCNDPLPLISVENVDPNFEYDEELKRTAVLVTPRAVWGPCNQHANGIDPVPAADVFAAFSEGRVV